MNINLKKLTVVVPALLFSICAGPVNAGKTIDDAGRMACVTDKWNEKEPEKGHKLVDYASRCVLIPDDTSAKKVTEDCAGKYEYMPDASWKASGTCTDNYPGGDKIFLNWEEGSQLKEYTYKKTGGTGKYQGVGGSPCILYDGLDGSRSLVG